MKTRPHAAALTLLTLALVACDVEVAPDADAPETEVRITLGYLTSPKLGQRMRAVSACGIFPDAKIIGGGCRFDDGIDPDSRVSYPDVPGDDPHAEQGGELAGWVCEGVPLDPNARIVVYTVCEIPLAVEADADEG